MNRQLPDGVGVGEDDGLERTKTENEFLVDVETGEVCEEVCVVEEEGDREVSKVNENT